MPIEAKFHIEPPWDRGMKVCSNGPGHMTKMQQCPYMGKNLKKSSSLEPKSWWPWKLVWSSGYSSTTKKVSNDDPRLTFDLLRKGQLCFLVHFYGKTLKWWINQTLMMSVILRLIYKISLMNPRRCTSGKGHSLTFVKGYLYFRYFKITFDLTPLYRLTSNYILDLGEIKGPKFIEIVEVTWPRWLPWSFMVKPLQGKEWPLYH